jgi:NAD(P)H-dependent flavin oxidoreductase YrpB (nitropropane dioxygenase family)
MLGLAGVPSDVAAELLDETAAKAKGAFGANFLVPFIDDDARVAIGHAAKTARLVEFFHAEPDPGLVELVHQGGALAAWQVSSAEEALQAERAGVDLVIAQGTEAGGHVPGKISLHTLLPAVLEAVSVPVLAAGGIGTARGMAAALAAGADGVRVGTRFVAATESLAHSLYKQALVAAEAEETVLTEAFGADWPDAPHRVLKAAVAAAEALDADVAAEMELGGKRFPVVRFSAEPPVESMTGHIEAMAMYAGESVDGVKAIQPAADIVRELSEGAEKLLRRWA